MPRAYAPRLSTVHLLGDIARLPKVRKAMIIPGYGRRATVIRVIIDETGDAHDFTIPNARAWLSTQQRFYTDSASEAYDRAERLPAVLRNIR